MATPDDYLQLSRLVYNGPGHEIDPSSELGEKGWEVLDDLEITPPNQGTANGYYGAAYRNKTTGEIVVANRGSRPSIVGLKQDWATTDVQIAAQGKLGIPAAFKDATKFASEVKAANPGKEIRFTGHSLGGGEAQVQAAQLGGKFVTFGAPGVAFAVEREEAADAALNGVNYVLPGDPVAKSGTHIGQVVKLGGVGGIEETVAMTAGLLIAGPLGMLAAALLINAFNPINHTSGRYMKALAGISPSSGGGGGKPAARLGDFHTCPMVTGIVPHVGGPVMGPGAVNVLIGGLPAARVGDMLACAGPPDTIIMGSATVLINGQPSARLGDMTSHGGVITVGHPTVLVGG